MDRRRTIAARLFFCTSTFCAGRFEGSHRPALQAEEYCRRWNYAGADMDGMVTTSGGRSAADGFRRRGELDGVALLHGEHAAAGYGFGEHGAVAGSARAAARYAASGICMRATGRSAAGRNAAEGVACGCVAGRTAEGDSWTEKTDIYAAVGTVAARAVTGETRRELRRDCDAAERPSEIRRSAGGLAGISWRQNDVG